MSVFKEDLLKGKRAFITGGGTGICKGITEAFARHGCDVAISSRKRENLEKAAKEISGATGRRIVPVPADVRLPDQVETAVGEAVKELGGIDILVNGAAGNFPVPIAGLSYKGFRTVVEIDLEGCYNVTKAAFPHLQKAAKESGDASIINITATLQYTGVPFQAHVSSAKAGIDALTRTCATEWGQLKIRANGIAPGPIDKTEGARRLAPSEEFRKRVTQIIPLKRFGEIEEIADAALFLVSPAARYITGAILVVDGGQWLGTAGVGL